MRFELGDFLETSVILLKSRVFLFKIKKITNRICYHS